MVGLGISEPSTVGQKTTQPALSGRSTAELRPFDSNVASGTSKACVKQTSGPTVTPSCTSTSFWNISNLNVYSKIFRFKSCSSTLSNFFLVSSLKLTVRTLQKWWDFSDVPFRFRGPSITHPPSFSRVTPRSQGNDAMHPTVLNLKVSGESNADVKAPGSGFRTGGKDPGKIPRVFHAQWWDEGVPDKRNLRRWNK